MVAISREVPSPQAAVEATSKLLNARLTRRALFSGAASAAVVFCMVGAEEATGRRNFGMEWSPTPYDSLVFSEETAIPIVSEEKITDPNKLMDCYITVPENSSVRLALSQRGNVAEPSEHLLRVRVSDQPIDRIATKIFAHDEDELPTKIHLGILSGDKRIEVWKHDPNDLELTASHLDLAFTARPAETILDRFEEWSPYLTGGIDGYDDFVAAAYGDIQENDKHYLLSYYGLRTDEDGGMSDWNRFLVYGSFRDADDTVQILVGKQSLQAEKIQYQGPNHVFKPHSGLMIDRTHPYFRYITENHMGDSSRGVSLKRLLGLLPTHREKFLTSVPLLVPSGLVDGSIWLINRHPSIATVSRMEADPSGVKYTYPLAVK